jgi:hypothetical protein
MFKSFVVISSLFGVSNGAQLREVESIPKPPPKSKGSKGLCTGTITRNDLLGRPFRTPSCVSMSKITASCTSASYSSHGFIHSGTTYPFDCNQPATTFNLNIPCDGSNNFDINGGSTGSSGTQTYVFSWVPVTAGTCSTPFENGG